MYSLREKDQMGNLHYEQATVWQAISVRVRLDNDEEYNLVWSEQAGYFIHDDWRLSSGYVLVCFPMAVVARDYLNA